MLGAVDTLSNSYEPPYFVFQEQYQVEYEATRLVPARTCTLKSIFAAFWNYDESSSNGKDVRFYVWSDNGGVPGEELLMVEGRVELDADVAAWVVVDISDSNLVVSGPFWVGHYEVSSGAPSSLIDTVVTVGANYYSVDGVSWEEDMYDYLHMAVVEYGEGEEATAAMVVSNGGDGDLLVSGIMADVSWVVGVEPQSFVLGSGESMEVEVRVSSSGLAEGRYYGMLHIMSNDPDTPDYGEPLVFDVGGGVVGEPDIVVTPDTLFFKVDSAGGGSYSESNHGDRDSVADLDKLDTVSYTHLTLPTKA